MLGGKPHHPIMAIDGLGGDGGNESDLHWIIILLVPAKDHTFSIYTKKDHYHMKEVGRECGVCGKVQV